MDSHAKSSVPTSFSSGWSSRILIASMAGIFFLTLYPFRFDFSAHRAIHRSPFLLNAWGFPAALLHFSLNILLFVPFGFGLAEKLRERGKSRWAAMLFTWLA